MSIRKAFTLFCKATSLHGWSYLSQEKMTKIWKMFLASFLLVIIIISTLLIWTNTNQVSFQMHKRGWERGELAPNVPMQKTFSQPPVLPSKEFKKTVEPWMSFICIKLSDRHSANLFFASQKKQIKLSQFFFRIKLIPITQIKN